MDFAFALIDENLFEEPGPGRHEEVEGLRPSGDTLACLVGLVGVFAHHRLLLGLEETLDEVEVSVVPAGWVGEVIHFLTFLLHFLQGLKEAAVVEILGGFPVELFFHLGEKLVGEGNADLGRHVLGGVCQTFKVGAEHEMLLVAPSDHGALRNFESINRVFLTFELFFIPKILQADGSFGITTDFQTSGSSGELFWSGSHWEVLVEDDLYSSNFSFRESVGNWIRCGLFERDVLTHERDVKGLKIDITGVDDDRERSLVIDESGELTVTGVPDIEVSCVPGERNDEMVWRFAEELFFGMSTIIVEDDTGEGHSLAFVSGMSIDTCAYFQLLLGQLGEAHIDGLGIGVAGVDIRYGAVLF